MSVTINATGWMEPSPPGQRVPTKLSITSTDEHYFVDGPPTRTAALLNEFLVKKVDLDFLAPGEYEFYWSGYMFWLVRTD